MHEFAITQSLIKQVITVAQRHNAKKVTRVKLLIGEQSAIVPECVQFYFDRLKKGTVCESAALEFRRVPLRIRCPKCGKEFSSIEEMCSCNAGAEIVSGEEMLIESIEIK